MNCSYEHIPANKQEINAYHIRYSADMRYFDSGAEWMTVTAENKKQARQVALIKIKDKCKRWYKRIYHESLIIHDTDIDIWEVKLLGKYQQEMEAIV